MGWRLEILHTTKVSYAGAARASYNEARMTPLALPSQTVLGTRMSLGTPAPIWTYQDYWGTTVSSFDIQEPHEELTVSAHATVETSPPPAAARPLPWGELRERAERGSLLEFLAATPRTTVDGEVAAAAAGRVAGADPLEAAAEIARWLSERVSYVPGATEVQTGAQEAWDKGQGVCQDIAHLAVALLRVAGLPGPVRLRVPALRPGGRARPGGGRAESRLDRVLDRRVGALRPDQPGARRRAARGGRARPRLRGRAAAEGHLPRRAERRARRHGGDDPALSATRRAGRGRTEPRRRGAGPGVLSRGGASLVRAALDFNLR